MIPVPVAVLKISRSTTADTFDMTRTCSGCRRTSPAKVSVYSVGQAETMIPLHDVSDLARERAIAGLQPAAKRTLALAACPHCKAREPAAERRVRRAAVASSALKSRALFPSLLALLTFSIAAEVIVLDHLYVDGAITILVGLAFTAMSWWLARATFRKRVAHAHDMADATVLWVGHEQPAAAAASAPVTARPADNGWPFA